LAAHLLALLNCTRKLGSLSGLHRAVLRELRGEVLKALMPKVRRLPHSDETVDDSASVLRAVARLLRKQTGDRLAERGTNLVRELLGKLLKVLVPIVVHLWSGKRWSATKKLVGHTAHA
jgi:hypothetical protein